jgi:cell division protein FtsB
MEFTEFIIPSITAAVSFFLGLKKGKAETESIVLQNLEKSINIYQILIQSLKEEIIELNAKVELLQQKLDEMEKSSRPRKKIQ